MKRNSIKKRITAIALSVVAIFSVGSATIVTASAAEEPAIIAEANEMNYSRDDALKLSRTVIKALASKIPYFGQAASSIFESLFNKIAGIEEPSLSQIAAQLREIESKIDESFKDLSEYIGDVTTLKDYARELNDMKATLDGILSNMDAIANDNSLTENEKLVLISEQIGDNSTWNNSGLIYELQKSASFLSGATFTDNRDLYTVVYDMNKKNAMFSGEAIDSSEEYVNRVMSLFVSAYAASMECLNAQHSVAQFTDTDKNALNPEVRKKYDRMTFIDTLTDNKISTLTVLLAGNGTEKCTSVNKCFDNFTNKDRFTFINKGNESVKLSGSLVPHQHSKWNVPAVWDIIKTNALSDSQTETLRNYAAQNGTTLYELLIKKVGFTINGNDVSSNDASNYNILAGGANCLCSGNHDYYYYKGINMNDSNNENRDCYFRQIDYILLWSRDKVIGGNLVTFAAA